MRLITALFAHNESKQVTNIENKINYNRMKT